MAEQAEPTEQHETQSETSGTSWLEQFVEDVAGTVVSPSTTLRQIGERQAVIPAIVLVLLIAAISVASQVILLLLGFSAFDTQFPGVALGSLLAVQIVGILWNFIWAPVLWTIVAGILYGVVYLLGGRGPFGSLWAATGFALVPQLLVAPVSIATEFFGMLGPGWQIIGGLVLLPVTIGAIIWTLVLFAISVRETMGVSTGRAAGAVGLFIGGLIMLAILLICAFFLIIAAVVGVTAS